MPVNWATSIDLNPVALSPSQFKPHIPYTDLTVQLNTYGEDEVTVSLSIATVGVNPLRLGVAVVVGVVATV